MVEAGGCLSSIDGIDSRFVLTLDQDDEEINRSDEFKPTTVVVSRFTDHKSRFTEVALNPEPSSANNPFI
jgi:hypothetical protein